MNIENLKKNAQNGSLVDQTILGICYLEGFGTEKNYPQAFRWLSLAAERGAPRAAANLGLMYRDGLATDQNIDTAIALFERAAESGEFFPNIWLARILIDCGKELEAYEWYVKAIAYENTVDAIDEIKEARNYISRFDSRSLTIPSSKKKPKLD